jgi:short subunit dehydrogenase-like uncharacterized protein
MGMSTTVAVYGATGYTGRRVVSEILARGYDVVVGGRSEEKLLAFARELEGDITVRASALDDAAALRKFSAGAAAVLNCAGPFVTTARPVARAAMENGAHYLDLCAEQVVLRWFFEEADSEAKAAKTTLVPSCAFDAGLTDLLIGHAADGLGPLQEVEIAYSVSNWRPSWGTTRSRLESMRRGRLFYDDGVQSKRTWPRTRRFDFPSPVGRQRVIVYPTPDALTVPRHTGAKRVQAYMTTSSLSPRPLGPFLPYLATSAGLAMRTPLRRAIERVFALTWRAFGPDQMTSDETSFLTVVRLMGDEGERKVTVKGRSLYTITAPLIAEMTNRLLADGAPRAGALAPAQAVRPQAVLDSLATHGVEYKIEDVVDGPDAHSASAGGNSSGKRVSVTPGQ